MLNDDPNEAVSGESIYRGADESPNDPHNPSGVARIVDLPYVPVPGVGGVTLEEATRRITDMMTAGDATPNQIKALQVQVDARFPESKGANIDTILDAFNHMLEHTVRLTPADRARLHWHVNFCPCDSCTTLAHLINHVIGPDGSLLDRPGKHRG